MPLFAIHIIHSSSSSNFIIIIFINLFLMLFFVYFLLVASATWWLVWKVFLYYIYIYILCFVCMILVVPFTHVSIFWTIKFWWYQKCFNVSLLTISFFCFLFCYVAFFCISFLLCTDKHWNNVSFMIFVFDFFAACINIKLCIMFYYLWFRFSSFILNANQLNIFFCVLNFRQNTYFWVNI